jgi:hypothetical protein
MRIYRELTEEEEKEFRKWARDNYEVFNSIDGCWHPVVQEECVKMNKERGEMNKEKGEMGE